MQWLFHPEWRIAEWQTQLSSHPTGHSIRGKTTGMLVMAESGASVGSTSRGAEGFSGPTLRPVDFRRKRIQEQGSQ